MHSPRGTSHAGINVNCLGTTKPVVLLQRTFLDWPPCFSQPWTGFSFPRIALHFHDRLAVSARNMGLVESFYAKIEPIVLMKIDVPIEKPGKVPSGTTEFPFEFTLKPIKGMVLHETYHGVYATTTYVVAAECTRKGLMSSSLVQSIEFVVEVPTGAGEFDAEPADFNITPAALDNVQQKKAIEAFPPFSISGQLHRTNCSITAPLTGEIVIDESEAVISSIELQLVRVETVAHGGTEAREATEIQNVQPVVILQRTFLDRLKAPHCTATAWIFIPAHCFALP